MAYLLCPIYNGSLRLIYKANRGRVKNTVRAYRFSRFFATVIALFTLIFILSGLFMLVIPELIDSIVGLIKGLPETADRISIWIQENVEQNPEPVSYTHLCYKSAQKSYKKGIEEKNEELQNSLFMKADDKISAGMMVMGITAVSYTHLDVYKRQRQRLLQAGMHKDCGRRFSGRKNCVAS